MNMEIEKIVVVCLLALLPVLAIVWLLMRPATEKDIEFACRLIRKKYAYYFARMEDLHFESFRRLKEMENKEIEELKQRLKAK